MATLFQVLQFHDNNGDALSGGKLYWYQAGTSTYKNTWKDESEVSVHTNPIILDAYGRPPSGAIFVRGSYKLIVKNSDDSITFHTIDNINEYDSYDFTGLTASAADLNSTTAATKNISGVPPIVYTVLLSDRGKTLMCDASTGNVTINLPSAVTVGNTFKFWIKKTDLSTYNVKIIPYGGQTLDGTTWQYAKNYTDFTEVYSDGSNWFLGGEKNRHGMNLLSTDYSAKLYDQGEYFKCDATSADITITLPSCSSVGNGYALSFKKIDSSANHVQLSPNGSDTIDGASNYFLLTRWHHVTIKADGNSWYILDESGSENEFSTGDWKWTFKKVADPGWITYDAWEHDKTIGDANSTANIRANADCEALFKLIWTNTADIDCPVLDLGGGGGRGASADDDWTAHKRITLPILGDCVFAQSTAAGGPDKAIGHKVGEQDHALTINEIPSHQHKAVHLVNFGSTSYLGSSDQQFSGGGAGYFGVSTVSDVYLTGYTGNSEKHSNFQPTLYMLVMLKL